METSGHNHYNQALGHLGDDAALAGWEQANELIETPAAEDSGSQDIQPQPAPEDLH